MVDDLAFELTYNWNNPQVVKTCDAKIAEYKRKNAKKIQFNNARQESERLEGAALFPP
jgi:hypothetical protein